MGALLLALLSPSGVAAAAPTRDRWYLPVPPVLERQVAVPPYRTQLEDGQYARSNCGPAVLGMALEAHGLALPNVELRRLTHTYQGTWPGRGGTALHHMARVAEDLGLSAHGLYDEDGGFRKWRVGEIAEQVAAGRMVVPLVRYGMLPGHETTGVLTGHYILLYAVEGNGFRYHDPAFRPYEQGRGRWISFAQLDAAMNPVLVPRQAVALGT